MESDYSDGASKKEAKKQGGNSMKENEFTLRALEEEEGAFEENANDQEALSLNSLMIAGLELAMHGEPLRMPF